VELKIPLHFFGFLTFFLEHKEERKKYQKEYYENNKTEKKHYDEIYYKKNKEK